MAATDNKPSPRKRAMTESVSSLALLAGIMVVLNVLGVFAFGRLDCTANDLFSLSNGSRDLVSGLTDELEIEAYFTESLPPPFNATERYVRDILSEYEAASNGRVRVTFKHPSTDADKEEADRAGIQRVRHQAIENDSVSIVEGYRGLVLRYLDRTQVISVVEDTGGLEYAITMKIKQLVGEKLLIGVLGGHEGPTPSKGLSKLRTCLPTYELREVQATSEIDRELAALLVVEPQTTLSEVELRRIDQYVMSGGSLGVFGGSMKINLGQGQLPVATPVDTGLNRLLRRWGVRVREGIVHDARCGRAPLRTAFGMMPVIHPPVPIAAFDEAQSEHPVLFRLSSAPLPFVSPLEHVTSAEGDFTVTTLASSSEQSWLVDRPSVSLEPRDPRTWRMEGESGPFPLIIAIEGTLPSAFGAAANISSDEPQPSAAIEAPAVSTEEARILVTGGSVVIRDEAMPQRDCDQLTSHLAFALNSIDWLAQDSDLIAIRAKVVEEAPIEVPQSVQMAEDDARAATDTALQAIAEGDESTARNAARERDDALERRKAALSSWDTKKTAYRWGNMLGIPMLFALFGVVRWRRRRSMRENLKA